MIDKKNISYKYMFRKHNFMINKAVAYKSNTVELFLP